MSINKNFEFTLDTASVISNRGILLCNIPFINYNEFSITQFIEDNTLVEECGSYFATEVENAFDEVEDYKNLPKYDSIDEFLESLDNS